MSSFNQETLRLMKERISGVEIPRTLQVLIGRKFQGVLLEDYLGVAYSPRGEVSKTCKLTGNPGTFYQTAADELAELVLSQDPIEHCLGFAALNALCQFVIGREEEKYNIYYKADVIKCLPLDKNTTVGMVGMIGPFIPPLVRNVKDLLILEDNPKVEPGRKTQGYAITRNPKDLADRDVMIITGSSVIEHSLEEVIDVTKNAFYKIVIGPTASWLPEIAFSLGIDAVGGMRYTDPDFAFRIIMEGGGTSDFARFAEKYIITKVAL
jgi:uncharacterized protein (DUF4213/DUF364 family)